MEYIQENLKSPAFRTILIITYKLNCIYSFQCVSFSCCFSYYSYLRFDSKVVIRIMIMLSCLAHTAYQWIQGLSGQLHTSIGLTTEPSLKQAIARWKSVAWSSNNRQEIGGHRKEMCGSDLLTSKYCTIRSIGNLPSRYHRII